MKKIFSILFIILVVTACLGYYFFYNKNSSGSLTQAKNTSSGGIFTTGKDVEQQKQLEENKNNTIVKNTDSENLLNLKDFKNNGITVKDVVNPGAYILAGDLGYCLADGSCPKAGSSTDYTIEYDEKSRFFTIILLKKPLGVSRDLAEVFLSKMLGIDQKDLCKLNYFVSTPSFVDDTRAGDNLGFSNCSKL